MKYSLSIFIFVSFCSFNQQQKNLIVGSWKLYTINGKNGFSESDKKMNELLQKGYSNYRAVFKADSTCVMTIHDLDKLVQKEIGKYWITKDGKNLISVTKNKAQYSSKIILLTKDTLRITPDLKQILTYVRAK